MHNQYLIFSGYHYFPGADWFHGIWYNNLFRSAKPDKIVVIGDPYAPAPFQKRGVWVEPTGDLGGCGQLLRREKQSYLAGVSAMWIMGLMYAYMCERDAIYVEQDALVFGHWIERLYGELGDKGLIFGTARTHGIATSLFLIRHDAIPSFIQHYIDEGPEDHVNRIPEMKVARIEARWPECVARHTMPFDTDRPLDLKRTDPWYVQKLTPDELMDMHGEGLVDTSNMPHDVKLFSNRGPVDP